MKATSVKYQKCFNLGNFENEVIGVEIEIEPGEKAEDCLNAARKFVSAKGDPISGYKEKLRECKNVLSEKDFQSYNKVVDAQKWIEENENENNNDLPF